MKRNNFYRNTAKNFIDKIMAFIGLIVLSPVFLGTALVVRIKLGNPVLYKQERAGINGTPFFLYKFRSMSSERDQGGNLLPDEMRLGTFGKKLRASSLDELPSLWNVMKGDMAVVGPRPLPTRYLKWYTKEEMRRHDVRPGITGLAQISGRNYMTWEEKFRLDVQYVDQLSMMLDIRILFKTIHVVLKHSNIETGSFIEHEGVIYRPLDVERMAKKGQEDLDYARGIKA